MTAATNAPAPRPSGGQLASITEVGAARASANLVRADHLVLVAQGLLTPHDVVAAAAQPGGRPVLRITLDQLLRAQVGWGQARSHAALTRLLTFCGIDPTPARLRSVEVAWLIDPRAAGQRLVAWIDVLRDDRQLAPWPGFPYVGAPAVLTTGGRP